jgi:hypothetical protein
MSLSYYYREGGDKLILCSTNLISSIPIFRTSKKKNSGPVDSSFNFLVLTGPVPVAVHFWREKKLTARGGVMWKRNSDQSFTHSSHK